MLLKFLMLKHHDMEIRFIILVYKHVINNGIAVKTIIVEKAYTEVFLHFEQNQSPFGGSLAADSPTHEKWYHVSHPPSHPIHGPFP